MATLSTASRQPAVWQLPWGLLVRQSMCQCFFLQQLGGALQTQADVCDGRHLLLSSSAMLQKPHASVSVVLDTTACTRNSCRLVPSAFCRSPTAFDGVCAAGAPNCDRSCCDGKLSTRCCVASCVAAGGPCSSIVTASVIQRQQLLQEISLSECERPQR